MTPSPVPSLGDVFTGASKAVLDKPGLYLRIWAATGLPALLMTTFATKSLGVDGDGTGMKAMIEAQRYGPIVGFILIVCAAKLVELAGFTATVIAAAARVRGADVSAGQALETGLSRFPAVLWTSAVVGLRVFGGFLLLIVPGIILSIRYGFSHLVATLEGKSGGDAAGRSSELIVPHMGAVVGYTLLIALLAIVVSGVIALIGTVGGRLAGLDLPFEVATRGVNALVSAWASAGSVVLFLAIASARSSQPQA